MNIINMNTATLQPGRATCVKDVEGKVDEWKKDIQYLRDMEEMTMSEKQMKSILVSMLLDTL